MEMKRISINVAKFIYQSRRPGSFASDESSWNNWVSYCVRGKIDQFL